MNQNVYILLLLLLNICIVDDQSNQSMDQVQGFSIPLSLFKSRI